MKGACVTVSLVQESRGGPFVFWDDLDAACRTASELGFAAIELFAPSPEVVPTLGLADKLKQYGLQVAALGTGAGWVKHGLQLGCADEVGRRRARQFIRSMIDAAAPFGAMTIIGSMQGRWGAEVSKQAGLGYLAEACAELGEHAHKQGTVLLIEPLNRYETNLLNTVEDGLAFLEKVNSPAVKLLLDLFHMNIEETDIAASLRKAGSATGHFHLADSNRRAAGWGHIDLAPVAAALKEIDYAGYVSAEAFSWPDAAGAAAQTIKAYQQHFAN